MVRRSVRTLGLAVLAGSGLLLAQTHGGWKRVDEPPPPNQSEPVPSQTPRADPGFARNAPLDQYGAPVQGQQGPQGQQGQNDGRQAPPEGPSQQFGPPPPQLTIKPGTFVTVRVNQPLSSDHNQPGDAFTATLVRPLVIDGVVVAQRGQIIAGRVAEAQKAGRVEGVSRLAVQLTELTLVDGQQVPLQSQLINRTGPTSVGRDVAAVAGTSALGAAIGASSTWDRGFGAGVGAGAGAAAGLIGVLLTRGHATVIYPEQVLTFRIEAPITVSTERAPQAFQYMDPREYERPYDMQTSRPGPSGPPPPRPYFYGPPVYPYPYYYGPSFAFYYGPRFYGRGYYGRGYYRRW